MNAVLDSAPKFRIITEVDLPEVLKIEATGHAYPWSEGIFLDCLRVGYYCPALISENQIQAYAVMSAAAGEAHIFNLCVLDTLRGNGLGEIMLHHLLECALAGKVNTVFLEVRPSNQIAINLYEKVGFIEVGFRKNYYPDGDGREDALIMAKDIISPVSEINNEGITD